MHTPQPAAIHAPPAQRADYPHFTRITTRWADNDAYGHVNNVHYYSYFDTAISGYLLSSSALADGALLGVCAESHCRYLHELRFPDHIDAGIRVEHLGRTSARYGIALFRAGEPQPAAQGWFVHVFLDRTTRRPAAMTPTLRQALNAIAASSISEPSATPTPAPVPAPAHEPALAPTPEHPA